MAKPSVMDGNPRTDDILEVRRRWEELRARGLVTEEMKKLLRNPDEEHTLLINGKGEYELVKYEQVTVGDGSSGVRAFVFHRNCFYYAVVWDDLGSSVMELDIPLCSYTKEVDTLPIEYGFSDGKAVLPVSSKGYIKTAGDMLELISALKGAKVCW